MEKIVQTAGRNALGKFAPDFAQYFSGQSFFAPVSTSQVGIFNVTFELGCWNNWHIHHADKGGGQILVCVAGRGYYQEWGKDAVEMKPGENGSNEWLELVDDIQYGGLK